MLAILAAGLACRGEVPRAEARGAGAPVRTTAQVLLGTGEGAAGERAWLVWLDASKGALYHPPGALALRGTTEGTGGRVSLRSGPAVGGGVYALDGRAGSWGIRGTASFTPDRRAPGGAAAQSAVQLAPVRVQARAPWGTGGVYTAAAVNEESGDLRGYELVVLPDSAGVRAVLTSFWDDGLPYAGRVAQSGGRWWLTLRTATGEERYELRPAAGAVTLVPAGPAAGDAVELPRRGDVEAAFSRVGRGPAPGARRVDQPRRP